MRLAKIGAHIGEGNPRYDSTVYTFENVKTKELITSTRYNLAQQYKLDLGNLSKIFNGKYKHCGGWKLYKE